MKQRLMRIAAVSSLIVMMGLGSSVLMASAKTSTHNTSKKTTSGRVTVAPTIVSGTQYTMTIKKGSKSYVVTFDTANVKLTDHKGNSITVGKIVTGNKIQVKGLVDTSSRKITQVSKVKDDSIK